MSIPVWASKTIPSDQMPQAIDIHTEIIPLPIEPSSELDAMLRIREQIIQELEAVFGMDACRLLVGALVRSAEEVRHTFEARERDRAYPPTAAPPARPAHPDCCGHPMRPNDFGGYYDCLWCCRVISAFDLVNDRPLTPQMPPKKPWTPTVPHPLLQIDEELKRAGAD